MVNVTLSYSPKHFLLKVLSNSDRRILFFWQVLVSIHKFIIELYALQCLLGGVGLFQISQKDRLFYLLWQPSTPGGNFKCSPPSCTLQKRPYSPLQFGQKQNMPEQSIERRAYLLTPYSQRQSRKRWWTIL